MDVVEGGGIFLLKLRNGTLRVNGGILGDYAQKVRDVINISNIPPEIRRERR